MLCNHSLYLHKSRFVCFTMSIRGRMTGLLFRISVFHHKVFKGVQTFYIKHLNENGIRYFCALSKEFVLITTNTRHPAFNVEDENLHIIYQNELSLKDALIKLKSEYGCERITIQTGGTLNNLFLREKLFDYVDIIIAPVLIGGKDTSTLIDGKSLTEECELSKLGVVKLQECVVLENSYLRLRYEVIH